MQTESNLVVFLIVHVWRDRLEIFNYFYSAKVLKPANHNDKLHVKRELCGTILVLLLIIAEFFPLFLVNILSTQILVPIHSMNSKCKNNLEIQNG
jgi:hypothetical protein